MQRESHETDRTYTQEEQNPTSQDNRDPEKLRIPPYFPSPPTNKEDYIVNFDGDDDPLNPQNWPMRKKIYISAVASYTCLCSTFASAIFEPATEEVGKVFGVSSEVATLTTSLFILGYAFGPLVWAPLSELRGRRMPIVVAMFGFTAFAAGAATAKDLQTVMLCRFFTGVMGSCPLTVIAAVFGDMYNHGHRSIAIAIFVLCIFMGPVLTPFIGGFTVMNTALGWRFEGYWCLIMGALSFILCYFFLPETYAPVVLVGKASHLRKESGNWAIRAAHEELDVDLKELVTKYFTRPVVMLVTEPVLFLVTFYMSFIYGLIYLLFTAYPLVFRGVHGFNAGVSGLPFFAVGLGVSGACGMTILLVPSHNRKLAANNFKPIPEWRLPQVMIGGVSFTVGLFWFGWTGNSRDIHWIVPTLAGVPIGFGIISIFMPLFNYIIDVYLMYAASAIAANTIMRSAFAAAFPLFATYMYEGLGIGLATTVLGCVAAALIPVPIVFHFCGKKLRERSKFAPTPKPQKISHDEESND